MTISNLRQKINNCHLFNKSNKDSSTYALKTGGANPCDSYKSSDEEDTLLPDFLRFTGNTLDQAAEGFIIGNDLASRSGIIGTLASLFSASALAAGLYYGYDGVKNLPEAVKKKDLPEVLESASSINLAGTISVDSAVAIAESGVASKALGSTLCAALGSPLLGAASVSMLFVHSGLEGILGSREVYHGIKAKDKKQVITGVMRVGIGATAAALATGGGVSVAAAAGAFFVIKTACEGEKIKTIVKNVIDKGKDLLS